MNQNQFSSPFQLCWIIRQNQLQFIANTMKSKLFRSLVVLSSSGDDGSSRKFGTTIRQRNVMCCDSCVMVAGGGKWYELADYTVRNR